MKGCLSLQIISLNIHKMVIKRYNLYMSNPFPAGLAQLPYFTLESYKQLAGISNGRAQTARTQLVRWHRAGKVLRVKRGVYMAQDFYERHGQDADFPAAVSAIINPLSYVSTVYVLQKHALLTEVTYPVTAITPRNTRTIENDLGTFTYQHVAEALYHGFEPHAYFGVSFYEATLAKALFDYLYLRPLSQLARRKSFDLAGELRLNLDEFPEQARHEFAEWVEESGVPKMEAVLANFEEHVWQP